jgi:hypothetical protein
MVHLLRLSSLVERAYDQLYLWGLPRETTGPTWVPKRAENSPACGCRRRYNTPPTAVDTTLVFILVKSKVSKWSKK